MPSSTMTNETARTVSDLMVAIGKQLNDSLSLVRSSETEEDFDRYREAISRMLVLMLVEVMNPIYAEHPDLKPAQLR